MDGEEGLAKLMGAAASGLPIPNTSADRYIDIALALGTLGQAPKKRAALTELVYARQLIRAQHAGQPIEEVAIRTKAATYVDRTYRGGPGDNIGTRQAVYTPDIYYYNYKLIAKHIARQLHAGADQAELFNFLMQGKFDPLNSTHLEHMAHFQELQ